MAIARRRAGSSRGVTLRATGASYAVARAYCGRFNLLEGLEGLLGRPVDLITAGTVTNPYLMRSIAATRSPVHAT